MGKLTLAKIEKYNLPKTNYTPDWDDSGYEFELPSGLTLVGFYRLNNSPTKMDSLEGLDGFIYIETEEELKELIGLTWDETMVKVKNKNPEFKIEDF